MPRRLFTLDEAERALVEVRPLVERLVERRADLLAAQARRAEVAAQVAGNGGGLDPEAPAHLTAAATAAERGLRETIEALHDLGVLVKDVDAGLVDFPTVRAGEEVLLCWQLGEERIGYWHRHEEGFAGRKPL